LQRPTPPARSERRRGVRRPLSTRSSRRASEEAPRETAPKNATASQNNSGSVCTGKTRNAGQHGPLS
jgi:hypothetical protein